MAPFIEIQVTDNRGLDEGEGSGSRRKQSSNINPVVISANKQYNHFSEVFSVETIKAVDISELY